MFHPIVKSLLIYYKYYPLIYAFVCAYHAYNYYEYSKVITHYIQLIRGKKEPPKPVEKDYEWLFIEEDILDEDTEYFDLNMMIMVTEPEPATTDIEGELSKEIDYFEIPI